MTAQDVALLLAVIGGTVVLAAWIARSTGDAARDVRLMLGVGVGLLLSGAGIYLS